MRLQSRLARIEARLPQKAASNSWDLSLLSDEALEALMSITGDNLTDEEMMAMEKLMAMIPEHLLREIERAYGGPDEQA